MVGEMGVRILFQSRRMILRAADPLRVVTDFVREVGATELGGMTKTPEESNYGIVRELVWELATGLQLHYLEDYRSACCFMVITCTDDRRTEEICCLVSSYLGTWSDDDVIRAIEESASPADRAQAVIRAGVAAPEEFQPDLWHRIGQAMSDPDPLVRAAGVWATPYSFWPQFRPLLEKVAQDDPDPGLRADAFALALAIAGGVAR